MGDSPSTGLLRAILSSFIKEYGVLSDQDFVMVPAYYNEKKNKNNSFPLKLL